VAADRKRLTPRVALMLATDLASSRAILRGISVYSERAQRHWIARVGQARDGTLEELAAWKPDGIIAKIYNESTARRVAALRVPFVNTTNIANLAAPRVAVDDLAIGRLAAQHLLERGFKSFAYVGFTQQQSPQSRHTAFVDELKKQGFASRSYTGFDLLPFRAGEVWGAVDLKFRRWLLTLPKPVAVFAYHDFLAWEVAQVCHTLQLKMPEELALLGVDDDELFCRLAHPPISSIAYPADRIGFEAAATLDRMMRGRAAPRGPVLIPPTGIVVRQSTDIIANADQDLVRAMRYIRTNLALPITVRSILLEVPVSRRLLEEKFRRVLGRSPLQEIHRVRIERARFLLSSSRMSIFEIAKQCGFSTPEHFAVIFRASSGCAPRDYRRNHGSPIST
jgi:LacI family transcriptional regulator